LAGARAADEMKYPDWLAQWKNASGGHFNPAKPRMRQEAPLTAEYQAIYEAGVANAAAGGQGSDPMWRCIPPGMPRAMIVYEGDGDRHHAEDDLHRDRGAEPISRDRAAPDWRPRRSAVALAGARAIWRSLRKIYSAALPWERPDFTFPQNALTWCRRAAVRSLIEGHDAQGGWKWLNSPRGPRARMQALMLA
jgi:hypothetical protein